MKKEVSIPLVATNRINMPQVAEDVLARGDTDMISMARPFLADAELVKKAFEGREDEINTCIGCNQACLDHIFQNKITSCLVNPRACHETLLNYHPTSTGRKIAVVGAGPAGLAFAVIAAQRGHDVHLFDSEHEIGGQFNIARKVPGKEEFLETIRYFERQLELNNVTVILGKRVGINDLKDGGFNDVILATGITPRTPNIEGIGHPKVLSYVDVLKNGQNVGKKVAIIGAGGIGFDVAEFLSHEGESSSLNIPAFMKVWGIDMNNEVRGGIDGVKAEPHPSPREIFMLQRSGGKMGAKLGKTTGWIHRSSLKMKQVTMISEASYERIDDDGLHMTVKGKGPMTLDVDNVIICAGQVSDRSLYEPIKAEKINVHLVGGADVAAELDAKRAIDQASRLAAEI